MANTTFQQGAETEKHLVGRKNQMLALWVCAESHLMYQTAQAIFAAQTDGK